MRYFLDTASLVEVKRWLHSGLVSGVTTNATLLADSGKDILTAVSELSAAIPGPLSVPAIGNNSETMVRHARIISSLAENIVIKIPATQEGLSAARSLSSSDICLNITFVFEPASAIPFLSLEPSYVSLILDRSTDFGEPPEYRVLRLRQLRAIIDNSSSSTQIIAASIRTPETLSMAIHEGADVVTVPPGTWDLTLNNPMTMIDANLSEGLPKRLIEDLIRGRS